MAKPKATTRSIERIYRNRLKAEIGKACIFCKHVIFSSSNAFQSAFFFVEAFDHSGGNSNSDNIIGYARIYKAEGADDRVLTDCHTWHYNAMTPDLITFPEPISPE